jgi:ribosomal protein L11 methyltransferase
MDHSLSEIEEALQKFEAKHALSESLPVELRVMEADGPMGVLTRQLRPGRVSPRLTIGSPWEYLPTGQGEGVLLIDPQDAFGNGNHPSTRLALLLLDELLSGKYGSPAKGQGWVLDAGCGSGVLALAAAALGEYKTLAVDLDPRAIYSARGNLRHNPGPGSKISLALGDLSCARGPFYLVLANLVPPLHSRVWHTLWGAVEPGGWLILSGFCETQKDSILSPYFQRGATEKALSVDKAWAGSLLHKPER